MNDLACMILISLSYSRVYIEQRARDHYREFGPINRSKVLQKEVYHE